MRIFSTFLVGNNRLGAQRPQRSHSLTDAGYLRPTEVEVDHIYTCTNMRGRMKQCALMCNYWPQLTSFTASV